MKLRLTDSSLVYSSVFAKVSEFICESQANLEGTRPSLLWESLKALHYQENNTSLELMGVLTSLHTNINPLLMLRIL